MTDWKKVKKYDLGQVVEGKRKVTMLLEGDNTSINLDLPYDLWFDEGSKILKTYDGKPELPQVPTKVPGKVIRAKGGYNGPYL
jgi:hypothetical protein